MAVLGIILIIIVALTFLAGPLPMSRSPDRCASDECAKSLPTPMPSPNLTRKDLATRENYSVRRHLSHRFSDKGLPDAPIHTASILSDETLPPATVRSGKPATLIYALRSPKEEASLRQAVAPAMLARLKAGASIDVYFDCSYCDESDAQALPQKLRLYSRTVERPEMRSLSVAFPFTPRLTQRTSIAGGPIGPYVALIFREGTRDLDRWAIPITVLTADDVLDVTDNIRPPLARKLRTSSRYPTDTVRIDFRNEGRQAIVTVPKKYAAMSQGLAQQAEWGKGVHVRDKSDDTTEYLVETGTDNAEISGAAHELLNQLTFVGRRISFDADASTEESDGCEIPIGLLQKQAVLSQAIVKCITGQRNALRTTLFVQPIQELLFNLARCISQPDDTASLPVLAVSGIPYSALQLLPVDYPGDRPFTCRGNLRPRTVRASGPQGLSDDFLGLHVALALTPIEIGENANHDRPSPTQGSTLTAVYATDPADALSSIFDSFAKFSSNLPQATVERSGDTFLSALFAQRNALQVIIINTHGRREIALPGAVPIPDRLLFANNAQAENPHFSIPQWATVTAPLLRQAFSTVRSDAAPLKRRPTILLLACDMAPYSGPGSNIPYMFIRLGARDVIVTETAVNAAMAEVLGRDLGPRLILERLPSVALVQSRRALFERYGSILPLMWADVEAQN